MGDQPPLAVDDIGIALLADSDRGDHVPDQLEIDLGYSHSGLAAGMSDGDGHVGLGASPEIDRAEPGLVGDRLQEARITREIMAAADRIRLEPRDLELFLAFAVDVGKLGDGRYLSQQPDEVIALLLERDAAPFYPRGPADLVLDLGDELADALGGRQRLLPLDLDGCAFGLAIAQ